MAEEPGTDRSLGAADFPNIKALYDLGDGKGPQEVPEDFEATVPVEIRLRGILYALRAIFRVKDGESILWRASTVMRRYDRMSKELGNRYHND